MNFRALIERVALSPWSVITGTFCSIFSFLWFCYEKIIKSGEGILSLLLFLFFFIIVLFIGIHSLLIRKKWKSYKEIIKSLHYINHEYRDVLYQEFSRNELRSRNELIALEEKTLTEICQIIRDIYQILIYRKCVVTFKLITTNLSGEKECETYVRSDAGKRDRQNPKQFKVGINKNTAFDRALEIRYNVDECSHFFSPNLDNEKEYQNERGDSWKVMYKSVIVVPVRALVLGKEGQVIGRDEIGFLCIDTMTKNRLNGDDHVHLLSSFADQMYNFISLMRGKYLTKNNQESKS